ncbi:uncharacterized protein LOC6564895 [Drosophila grimshawi]|uniref:GH11865 n=1 Tax=Drosophila grimshawi TaxID=7222 RepID=B4JLI1_DROGR|nr:uncharacterized protein LOC6564895 [Drosophila grimshawi]EDW00434.1 GH11865 [Drosophila grimshawi]
MFKITACCFLLLVLVAISEARKPSHCSGRCSVKDKDSKERVCVRSSRSKICTKLRACRLRERNCGLRNLGLAPLKVTNYKRCANVKGSSGSAPCASLPRRQSHRRSKKDVSRCDLKSCKHQKRNSCWHSKESGRKLWLSSCEARKRNCRNAKSPYLQLVRVKDSECHRRARHVKG